MLNKKMNLSLKLNLSLQQIGGGGDQPFTPLEQTLKTPIDHPMIGTPLGYGHNNNNNNSGYFSHHQGQGGISSNGNPGHSLYQHYNESDDILTDIDEPIFGSYKTTKNYTVSFNQLFDQLLVSTYQYFLSLPTTTPFLGIIPPSGLVSKISNETLNRLIQSTANNAQINYDQHNVISEEMLRNTSYKPIFLQLIRKRLLDICSLNAGNNVNGGGLPTTTSITITLTSGGNGVPYTTNVRQSSISNLSLNELNINNFNGNSAAAAAAAANNRSRSSSVSLRKQSLTRNNSYSGNNWLHVGNINQIRTEPTMHNDNLSTDSLQSIQDFVPQSFINKSASNTPQTTTNSHVNTPNMSHGFNAMMLDYQTPPSSNKGSISHTITPPSLSQSSHNLFGNGHNNNNNNNNADNMVDDFNFYSAARSRSSSRGGSTLPRALNINTEAANLAKSNPQYNSQNMDTLDSPFMSAITPSDDCGYFSNGFAAQVSTSLGGSIPESPTSDDNASISSTSSSGSSKGGQQKDAINLPSQFSLSEKKRDSLKLKRGIH